MQTDRDRSVTIAHKIERNCIYQTEHSAKLTPTSMGYVCVCDRDKRGRKIANETMNSFKYSCQMMMVALTTEANEFQYQNATNDTGIYFEKLLPAVNATQSMNISIRAICNQSCVVTVAVAVVAAAYLI